MEESARGTGFDARVEPFWMDFSRRADGLGFWARWRERRRLLKIVASVNRAISGMGASPDGWENRSGECVSNLRVARFGLIPELQKLVRDEVDGADWPHLMALREAATIAVPVEFARPFEVGHMAIASSTRLNAELKEVNERVGVDRAFALKKMVNFMNAGEDEISKYESRAGSREGFWARFAFVLLRKLVERSVESRLPAILS